MNRLLASTSARVARRACMAGLTALALFPALLPTASAEPSDWIPQTHSVPASDQPAALAYWTPQRMRSLTDATHVTPGIALPPTGDEWRLGGAVTQSVGRLFFTGKFEGKDTDSSCTATLVTPLAQSTHPQLVTAGHCLVGADEGQPAWNTRLVFVPGYRDGKAPAGVYPVAKSAVPQQYLTSSGPDLSVQKIVPADQGFFTLGPSAQGKHLESLNLPTFEIDTASEPLHAPAVAFGYPRSASSDNPNTNLAHTPAFTGGRLAFCFGLTAAPDLKITAAGVPCAMSGGASGGPQLQRFNPLSGTGVIRGVNSFGEDKYLYATLFTEHTQALQAAVAR